MNEAVTFHLRSGKLLVPRLFYDNVVNYVTRLEMETIYLLPNVNDQAMFLECLKLMIDWKDDRRNGYELECSSDYKRFRKLQLWQS